MQLPASELLLLCSRIVKYLLAEAALSSNQITQILIELHAFTILRNEIGGRAAIDFDQFVIAPRNSIFCK
jgi:hypothetical protein